MFLVILVLAVSFFLVCLFVCSFCFVCLFGRGGWGGGSNTFFAASRPSNQLIVDVTVH